MSDLLAVDTETTGVDYHDEAFMISIAYTSVDGNVCSHVWDKRDCPDWDHALEEIEFYLIGCKKIIMHNAKFDIHRIIRLGFDAKHFDNVDSWEDTQAMAHLYDEQDSTSLKHLARVWLGEETNEDEEIKAWRRKNKMKKEDGYYPIPNEILAPYAAKDAEFTLRLYQVFSERLPKDLYDLYRMEKELTLALLSVENNGIMIDREYVSTKRKEYGDRIFQTKKRIGELAGPDFNPQSPQQVLHALAERGVNVGKTDKATLSSLEDELAGLIVELREANKIKATYFDALWNESRDGILHPNFRQHGTRTGRMSSGSAEA